MPLPFIIAAVLTLAGAVAAMSLRNLVHCALCLIVTFAGLAALFLQLNAQFVGFAQILVYIGAVAILILFAILLTRSSEMKKIQAPDERGTNPANASESSPSPPGGERAGGRGPPPPVLPFVGRTQAPDPPSRKPANAPGSSPPPPRGEGAGEGRPSPWSWWMGIAV